MCRLGVFPAGFPAEAARKIMLSQSSGNCDGYGAGWEEGGKLHVLKSKNSIFSAEGRPMVKHMPHAGWSILHTRQGTVGLVTDDNAHPFIKENYVVAHNGSFRHHRFVRDLAPAGALVGETDSEAAAYLMSRIGAEKFYERYVCNEWTGVFAAIDKAGNLWVMRDTHDLYMADTEYGTVFTTEKIFKNSERFDEGYICLSPNGDVLKWKYEKPSSSSKSSYNQRSSDCGSKSSSQSSIIPFPKSDQKGHSDEAQPEEDVTCNEKLVKLSGFAEDGKHILQELVDGMYYITIRYPSNHESKLAMRIPLYIVVNGRIKKNPEAENVSTEVKAPRQEKAQSDAELTADTQRWMREAVERERELFDSEGCD